MAKTSAQRRAIRKRKEQTRARQRWDRPGHAGDGHDSADRVDDGHDHDATVRQLIATAARTGSDFELDRLAGRLARLDPDVDARGTASAMLVSLVAHLWEGGWQPADLAHVVRREGSARLLRLVVGASAQEARTAGAAERAPEEWTAQLAALGALDCPRQVAVLSTWRQSERLEALAAWRESLGLIHWLTGLPKLQQLAPPPSQWGRHRTRQAETAAPRVLGRIRALLAKAESTEFPDEAEALSGKAQELMTRHAVDAAVLDAEHGTATTGRVGARRVHLDNPYPEAKMRLLDAVAEANDVRAIWLEAYGMATLVGLPADLDSVELLFTSLLVQATRAMTATGREGSQRTRSPSFRRGFLTAYAARIGERLVEAREQATAEAASSSGRDLVPVLRERSQAVDDAFATLFPETYAVRGRSVDAQGWHAGRAAAENAHLGSGREEVPR